MNKAFRKPLFKWYSSKYYKAFCRNPSLNYYEWLRLQPTKFIEMLLGEREAALFLGQDYDEPVFSRTEIISRPAHPMCRN